MRIVPILIFTVLFFLLGFFAITYAQIQDDSGAFPEGFGVPQGNNPPPCPPAQPQTPSELGTITAPPSVPTTDCPTSFVADLVRGFLSLLIVAAFIIAIIWTTIAGFKFIFAAGDPKDVSAAWSQIYWGLIGLVVVVGAFAIIKMVEVFFGIKIISDFQLPQR